MPAARRRREPPAPKPRLLLAAQFLLSIPLGTRPAEEGGAQHAPASRAASVAGSGAHRGGEGTGGTAGTVPPPAATPASPPSGAFAAHLRLRGDKFRFIASRGARATPSFRSALLREGVLDGRLVFSPSRGYPSATASIIRYDAAAETAAARSRQGAAARLLTEGAVEEEGVPAYMWKGRSHARLLRPEGEGGGGGGGLEEEEEEGRRGGGGELARYNPAALDDPTVFDAEGGSLRYEREGYVMSILAFRPAAAARAALNAQFARAHPWLDFGPGASLTLTQIRALKARALDAWWARGWEVSTLAIAIVSFERLVLKRLVSKGNRRLAFAACALLAFKMNEAREAGAGLTTRDVLTELEARFGVPRRAIVAAEFPVFVHLGFALHVPPATAAPHLERLLAAKRSTPAEYLGPALHRRYALLAAARAEDARAVARQYGGDMRREDRALLAAARGVRRE
jgi:hypothetical protein